MSWDIQINPTAEALHVSYALVEAIDEFAEDFHIRYCFVEPSDEAIAALRRVGRKALRSSRPSTRSSRTCSAARPWNS